MPGIFITFEGPDGSGKSTQLRLLAERLRGQGLPVVINVEPGGTRIGQQIRHILLDPANQELCSTAEMLLYFASRAQAVEELILPALQRGAIVLSDRFTDSTLAYQGGGRGLGDDPVLALDAIACHGLKPDLTIVVDIESEAGLARALARNEGSGNRMDEQALEFHRRVRAAYQRLALREPDRVRLIDGSGDIETVARAVWAAAAPLLEKARV